MDDGWSYFNCMRRDYRITPIVENYFYMVYFLFCGGCLDMALEFIHTMEIKPDASMWGYLLAGCRIHTNLKLGEYMAGYIYEADAKNISHYVILSNIYVADGRWDDT
jgi:hypothetical protein